MNKSECREQFLAERLSLSWDDWNHRNENILKRASEVCARLKPGKGLLFYPIESKKEIDLRKLPVLLKKLSPGWMWCLPVMTTDMGLLSYHWIIEEPLVKARFGVWEPTKYPERLVSGAELSLIMVPLIIADQRGNRVGYGKGFYDRFLANEAPTALRVGVSLFPPIPEISDVSPSDQRLDMLICPDETIPFTQKALQLIGS